MSPVNAMPRRVLIVMPSWVGDAVMAMPLLRSVRRQLGSQAVIHLLARPYVRDVVDACPWVNRVRIWHRPRAGFTRRSAVHQAARLRAARYDAAILLPNSWRSAWLVRWAGVPRRIGYARQGRGILLTEGFSPPRVRGAYEPISAVDYYLKLGEAFGAPTSDRHPELFTRPEDDRKADAILRQAGISEDQSCVLFNAGAATKGGAKLWPPQRYAQIADRLSERYGVRVLLNGSPADRPVLDQVRSAAQSPLIDLTQSGGTLRLAKSFARRCALSVSNDSGGRHIAIAMGVPNVSLFGPTDPRWAAWSVAHERVIQSPNGKMDAIDVDEVDAACTALWQSVAMSRL